MKFTVVKPQGDSDPRPALREHGEVITGPAGAEQPTIGDLLEIHLEHDARAVRDRLLGVDGDERRFDVDEVDVHAPLDPDGRFFAVGGAYTSHLRERDRTLLVAPHQWVVPDTSIIGPDEPIRLPDTVSEQVKPAVELCAVIGRGGSYIGESEAYDHIAGYTISNDVTARTDWPGPRGYKLFDTFSPVGPHVVTADKIADPMDLWMSIRQDGQEICSGSTAGHRFTLSFLVSYLSTMHELRPGDVISTGDPGGVTDRLRPGSTVELEIEGIGKLANGVEEGSE